MSNTNMIIPYQEIPTEALENLLKDFVTRDGTDYGENEASLESKIAQAKIALENKAVFVTFDDEAEMFNIVGKEELNSFMR
jgi:uncharacterized protein YheU (UPF0270 family)